MQGVVQNPRIVFETAACNDQYGTRPKDVPLRGEATGLGTFGTHEVEQSAGRLILFFKAVGRWELFTLTQLRDFYRCRGWDPDMALYGLIGAFLHDSPTGPGVQRWKSPLVVMYWNGRFAITDEFIIRCMAGTSVLTD